MSKRTAFPDERKWEMSLNKTNQATSFLLVLAVVLLALPAHAATFQWDGSQNNQWNDGSNWEGNIGWPNGTTDSVTRHAKYVTFQLAEVAVPRQMFAAILNRIAQLANPPPSACECRS